MLAPAPAAHPGTLHFIPPSLSAFEYSHISNAETPPQNILLWIGGLYDTFGSVKYPSVLASRLPPSWSLAVLWLSSAGKGWGVQGLDADVTEMAKIISYFQQQQRGGKLVIMGHSTGCQDVMHYLSSQGERPRVDGAILQAPVSDREFMLSDMGSDRLTASIELASKWIADGKGEDCLPMDVTRTFPGVAISARRWYSLAAKQGQDDYFSSDLPEASVRQSFGAVPAGTKLLILSGEKDEYVPAHIDIPAMLARWADAAKAAGVVVHEHSTTQVPGASHNLNGNPSEILDGLIDRVVDYLKTVP